MFCHKCGAKVEQGAKFCTSCGSQVGGHAEHGPDKVEYFSISPGRLVLFSVLTFNLYEIYWFYKNWQAVKQAEGREMYPFWRAVFTIFFCHDFFKKVLASVKRDNYSESFSPGWLAAAYIVLLFVGNGYGRMEVRDVGDPWTYLFWLFVLLVITPLPLLPIQNAINFHNEKIGSKQVKTSTFTGGEVMLIIVGLIITGLAVLGTLTS